MARASCGLVRSPPLHLLGIDMDDIIKAVFEHASETQPKECCGIVIERDGELQYVRCENLATDNNRFVISEEVTTAAEDSGELRMIAHSHVYESPVPSDGDKRGIEITAIPWLIVNYPNGHHTVTAPSGYKAPLIGRTFCKGVLDCYALVKDYFEEELHIALPEYVRPEIWFEEGRSILLENFEEFGFKEIKQGELQPNDCLLIQAGSSVPNHCAVYIGDNKILHHVFGRLSSREIYGEFWRRATTHYLRYVGK